METTTSSEKKRLYWIDWMKAIGITLIVYGHFFSVAHWYVYTFSVPLFFIISGFLCKRETDVKVFWRKLWYNLIVPMVLIQVICHCVSATLALRHGTFDANEFVMLIPKFLLGFHSGVGMMWFVYTLILLKLILQFAPRNRWVQALLFIIIPASGIYIDNVWPELPAKSNSIINVTMAYPFFMIGFYAQRCKSHLIAPISPQKAMIGVVVCVLILYGCTKLNEGVWMYINGYGNYFALFLLGGCTGTFLTFLCSKRLDAFTPPELLIYLKERS